MNKAIEILEQYLSLNSIFPKGILAEDIRKRNYHALFYVIYAIKNFSDNKNLLQKIELLAQKRGNVNDNNDIRRNYYNQLFEFHALFILTKKMHYRFIDFEVSSNKSYAKKNSNCDILVEKDNKRYFVDAKQSSTELLSESQNLKYKNLININNPLIPDILEKYIKRLIRDAEEKGCDFLALQIPKWELPNLSEKFLNNFLGKISEEIKHINGRRIWPIKDIHITKLIFPKGIKYFEIDIINSN